MKLILKRSQRPNCTIGELSNGMYVLERPWLNNAHDISCIPSGTYTCVRINSPKFGVVFEVTNVPDRSHILIHNGNTVEDCKGCLLIGKVKGYESIASSRDALKELMETMPDKWELEIV